MDNSTRWTLRDVTGRMEGPFTTEKILYKISRGECSGEEMIALYPGDRWVPITQEPQFYDRLLETLSNENSSEDTVGTEVPNFTRGPDDTAAPQKAVRHGTAIREETPKPKVEVQAESGPEVRRPQKKKRKKRPADIELVDMRPKFIRELFKRGRWPVLLLAGGLVLAAAFSVSSPVRESRIHLIAPQKNLGQLAIDTLKGRVRQGITAFMRDTFDGYATAQNELVYVVERAQKNGEIMGWLCMTYLELWPYAYQDTADAKVITGLVQLSSTVDPGGRFSATCRAVDLITRARFVEAKSLVETQLESQSTENNPPILFYFLKGYLLTAGGDYAPALGYLQSAQQLLPNWLLPFVVQAQALSNLERYPEAAKLYQTVLKANPNHSQARIELGLIEYKHFLHFDVGEQYLNQALENEDAPRNVLSRGHFGLAEIALKKNNQKRALKEAQRAYSLNSSNNSAKNLIVELGGVNVLRGTKVKGQQLMFEGDQFFREGDCHAAQAYFKAAFEDDSKNAVAAMKAAQCLWKLSFSTEAMDWLQRSIKADPRLIEAYVTLAEYQAERYNFLAAARVLEQAKEINPKSNEVYRGFAQVELRRGNPKGAVLWGKRALQIYENDVETLILLADASLALKDPKMAYNYANQAKELDVNHRRAQILYAQAIAGLQGVDSGSDYLLRLVNNYPLIPDYRLALGKMLLADERYQQAEEIFRQITRIEEKSKEAYMELAKVLKAQGEMGEALELLLKAAVLDPADAEPLYLAGLIYIDQHRAAEAAVQFQRVLTINKLYPLVNYQLGRAALMMNDAKAALNYAEQEKRANPSLADPYLLAADAQSALQQFTNCSTEYARAVKLRPQPASVYVKMATCDRKAGLLEAAVNLLNVAATKESGYADIYKEFGAIYELKGDVNKAIEAYQNYFVLDPDSPDRAQIEGRVSALQSGRKP